MRRFCKDVKEQVTKIINYKKKEAVLLTNEEIKWHYKQSKNYVIYVKKGLVLMMIIKKYHDLLTAKPVTIISRQRITDTRNDG